MTYGCLVGGVDGTRDGTLVGCADGTRLGGVLGLNVMHSQGQQYEHA